jgi:hypothetical protein
MKQVSIIGILFSQHIRFTILSVTHYFFVSGLISSFVTAETALMFPEITSPGSSVLLLKVEISYIVLFLVVAYDLT